MEPTLFMSRKRELIRSPQAFISIQLEDIQVYPVPVTAIVIVKR